MLAVLPKYNWVSGTSLMYSRRYVVCGTYFETNLNGAIRYVVRGTYFEKKLNGAVRVFSVV